jgi:hypothetical protein
MATSHGGPTCLKGRAGGPMARGSSSAAERMEPAARPEAGTSRSPHQPPYLTLEPPHPPEITITISRGTALLARRSLARDGVGAAGMSDTGPPASGTTAWGWKLSQNPKGE